MKNYLLHIIMFTFVVACLSGLTGKIAAEGIRIVPQSVTVKNDSLHLWLEMDLNSVHVNSLAAVIFTPELAGKKGSSQKITLPSVVITGGKRFRFERRERALATSAENREIPYLILLDNNRTGSKNVRYRISIPYTSWMQQASLLLRQEIKDCCDLQLLGVDTLKRNLSVSTVQLAKNNPIPALDAESHKDKPVQRDNHVPRQAREQISLNTADVNTYASMVSFLTPDPKQENKHRSKSTTLYIDYPLGKDEVYPDFKNNREEIGKIDASLLPVLAEGYSELERIEVKGYASPDGNYGDNEKLAANRSRLFAWYVQKAYGIPARLFDVSSVAEDWNGLEDLLLSTKPSYYTAALDIIRRFGIFSGREKQLMNLQGGIPYKDMLKRLFPLLRRIEFVVEYRIRALNAGEASEMIYTHPDLLSLEEMYSVARYYRPGTEQYREVYEVAAFHFPDDVITNVNAASAVMLTGDLKSAWGYLRKVEADPRAWNNLGVLMLMEGNPEGATVWFRKAVGVEPRKARRNLQFAEGLTE